MTALRIVQPRYCTLLALGVMTLCGCRWLPMVRPSASIDPRTLSNPTETHPAPPVLAVHAGTEEVGVLPPLPEMRPVSDEVALAGPAPGPASSTVSSVPPPNATAHTVALAPTPPTSPANAEPAAPLDAAVAQAVHTPTIEAPRQLPQDPESQWRLGLEQLLALARAQAVGDAKAGQPGLWWARERVLDRLALADGSRWQIILERLDAAENPSFARNDPPPTPYTAPAPEPSATEPPPATPALTIVALRLCRKIEGFGNYEPIPDGPVRRGQVLGVYWEVDGLTARNANDWHESRLASSIEVLTQGDGSVAWQLDLGEATDRCRRARRDFFVNARWDVPSTLEPGSYVLRVRTKDLLAGTEAASDIEIVVQ